MLGPGSSRLPHVPPPRCRGRQCILSRNSWCSCWGQGLCRGHRSGDTEGRRPGLAKARGAPGPAVWGWTRARGCSFVKKRDSGFPTSGSEQRGHFPVHGSSDVLFCFNSFDGEGKEFSFRRICSWKKTISIQMCFPLRTPQNY